MKNLLFYFLLFSSCLLTAQTSYRVYEQDPGLQSREHQVDIIKMSLAVEFKPKEELVIGKVTHTLVSLRTKVDTLFFDAPGIKILNAFHNKNKVEFKTNSEGIVVYFSQSILRNQEHQISFDYEVNPNKGIYFIGWNADNVIDPKNQIRQQIWTQGQGTDNRYWIPMYDNMNDKFITETSITFDSDFQVLSNGQLINKTVNNGKTTWNYEISHPHPGYLLMIAIGKYAIKSTKSINGTPVHFWYYPEHPERLELTSQHTEKMIEFLESETGIDYPWSQYSQVMVQDFLYGAMENTTATIFGDFFWIDEYGFNDRNYIGVNCHELTHQWFGDYITARSRAFGWLQESWATYYAKLFNLALGQPDDFKWEQYKEFQSALNASKKDNLPVSHSSSGTARWYPKGSAVIQMLRYVVGDEHFKIALKHYLEKHAYANVETNDFYRAFQDALGMNLNWFFEQWLLHGGEPHYKINYDVTEKDVLINVQQIHPVNELIHYFKMPVKIRVRFTDGTIKTEKHWIDGPYTSIRISKSENQQVEYVIFDVNNEILKKETFLRSDKELLAQALLAENAIDRFRAWKELENTNIEIKREALKNALLKENFFGLEAEIAKQLANDKEGVEFLAEHWDKMSPKGGRRAFVNECNTFNASSLIMLEKLLSDYSYNNMVGALEKLAINDPNNIKKYLEKTKDVLGMDHKVKIKWLELALIYNVYPEKQDALFNELINYGSHLYEFRTRTNAFDVYEKIGFQKDEQLHNLIDAALRNNSRLANPALSVLNNYIKTHKIKEILSNYLNTHEFDQHEQDNLAEVKKKLKL